MYVGMFLTVIAHSVKVSEWPEMEFFYGVHKACILGWRPHCCCDPHCLRSLLLSVTSFRLLKTGPLAVATFAEITCDCNAPASPDRNRNILLKSVNKGKQASCFRRCERGWGEFYAPAIILALTKPGFKSDACAWISKTDMHSNLLLNDRNDTEMILSPRMSPVLVTRVKPGFTQMKEGSAYWNIGY